MVAWLFWLGCLGSEPEMALRAPDPRPREGGAQGEAEILYALQIEDSRLLLSLDLPCPSGALRLRAHDEALLSVPLRVRGEVAREGHTLLVRCTAGERADLEYVLPAQRWPLRLDGRSLFLLPEATDAPVSLAVLSPRGEVQAAVRGSRTDHVSLFSAEHARDLLSGPLLAGQPFEAPRALGELPIEVLFAEAPPELDLDQLASDLERALGSASTLWGPPEKMRIFWVFGEPSPPLISRRALALATSPRGDRREMLREALSAFSRARVARCHPSLDGVASYYDVLLSARLGLSSEEELLSELSAAAREARSGRDPSRVVAWLLDAAIRRESDDRSSLDTLAGALCAGPEGALEAAGYRALGETFGASLLDGARLDYGGALQWFGLGWREDLTLVRDPGASPIAARRFQRWLSP